MGKRNGRANKGFTRDEIKARHKRERKRIIVIQRIFITAMALVFIGGGGFAIVWNLPAVKLDRALAAGKEYTEEAFYDSAIESFENALKIDSTSVKAYQCMAGAYLDMKDDSEAKQILIEGWENTQDEGLLNYYCTVTLNEAVAEINDNNCTFETMQKIVDVLTQNADNEDAIELMHTAYGRFTQKLEEDGNTAIFYDGDEAAETCGFSSYEQLMNKLFEIYRISGSEAVKNIIGEYSVINTAELRISRQHLDTYRRILEDANALEESEYFGSAGRNNLIACLNKENEIQGMFADMFTEFDAGNYDAAKDFIVTDTYTQLRDEFINGTVEYWNGATYIPLCRESVILKQAEEGIWTFEFPDFKENENTAGVITVWGNKMADNGIQRSCIAYEPAKESDSYFPHTEYVISYMYSNVQKERAFEPELNYHLETRTWTEEGMTTIMIGDWGGPYQWEKAY